MSVAAGWSDIAIVGAGLSGIDAAYRFSRGLPGKSLAVFEARDAIGGTWDLFRYPGIRSDSDMFTLGFPFRPWTEGKAIADGPSILRYIRETARAFDLEGMIRFRHRVRRAAWSAADRAWTLTLEVGEERSTAQHRCRFLYLCSGYYDYERPHAPALPGADTFRGRIVHPQFWPSDLDYGGKRVVVIGSGATAVTLVPALAEHAAHVTMLQRSPTYIMSLPARDAIADAVRRVLPPRLAHRIVRGKNILVSLGFYQLSRRRPALVARWLRKQAADKLPSGYPVDRHFQPTYDPWDQRLCLIPDDDLFRVISDGRASVVTAGIESLTASGIRTTSGEELAADVIVTATGLTLLPCGGIDLTVDGRAIRPADLLVFKGVMLSGIPNLAWCVGYSNASWTLRADASSRYVTRLIRFMDRRGHQVVVPQADPGLGTKPLLDLASGYVRRAENHLPKQGARPPWYFRQNYLLDLPDMLLSRIADPALAFRGGPAT